MSDQEELIAHFATAVINYCGKSKESVRIESILGRPLRANWDAALAEKDRKRREGNRG
jgi:hypothetical protein